MDTGRSLPCPHDLEWTAFPTIMSFLNKSSFCTVQIAPENALPSSSPRARRWRSPVEASDELDAVFMGFKASPEISTQKVICLSTEERSGRYRLSEYERHQYSSSNYFHPSREELPCIWTSRCGRWRRHTNSQCHPRNHSSPRVRQSPQNLLCEILLLLCNSVVLAQSRRRNLDGYSSSETLTFRTSLHYSSTVREQCHKTK